MSGIIASIQEWATELGGVGLFIIALLDSSFLSFPQVNDLLIIVLSTKFPERMPYYAGMTTVGSLIGCFLLYGVARRGGEVFLRKRLKGPYVDRAIALYQRHGLLAVVVPALLPPPVPFKVFVLLAGAASVSPVRFGIAVAVGRGIRYFGQGYLAVLYGEQAAEFMKSARHRDRHWPRADGGRDCRGGDRPAADVDMDLLPFNAVHVDLVHTDDPDAWAQHEAYRALLSPDEHERMARLVFERDRRRFLLTRALVRTMLSRYAAVRARRLGVHRQRARPSGDSRSAARRARSALQPLAYRGPDRLRGHDRPRGRRRRRAHRAPPHARRGRAILRAA